AVGGHGAAHGLQADHGGSQDLATAEGRKPVAEGRCRCHLPQWRRGDRRAKTKRRLTRSRHPVSRIARAAILADALDEIEVGVTSDVLFADEPGVIGSTSNPRMSLTIATRTALLSTTHLRGLRINAMQSMAYASPTAQISPSLLKLSLNLLKRECHLSP